MGFETSIPANALIKPCVLPNQAIANLVILDRKLQQSGNYPLSLQNSSLFNPKINTV